MSVKIRSDLSDDTFRQVEFVNVTLLRSRPNVSTIFFRFVETSSAEFEAKEFVLVVLDRDFVC